MGGEAEGLKVGADVEGRGERERSSGKVGLGGEVAEIGGDGGVASGGQEYVAVVEGVSVFLMGRVVVEGGVEGEERE